MMPFVWDDELDNRLRTMRDNRVHIVDIASSLGCGYSTIDARVRKLGLTKRTNGEWTGENIERLKAMWADGLSARQIAEEMNVSRNAVIGKVHRLGLPGRMKAPKKERPRRRSAVKSNHAPAIVGKVTEQRKIKTTRIINGWTHEAYEYEPVKCESVRDNDIPLEQRCTLVQLTNKTCRWPIGMPGEDGFYFCGGPSDLDVCRPYCWYHSRIAYSPRR